MAQAIAPESRIVYVDNDPIVFTTPARCSPAPQKAPPHTSTPTRRTLTRSCARSQTLDFSKPVAVMALMVLQYIPDPDHPHQIVRRLMQAVPSGSYLAISDTTRDIDTQRVSDTTAQLNTRMGPARMTLCSREGDRRLPGRAGTRRPRPGPAPGVARPGQPHLRHTVLRRRGQKALMRPALGRGKQDDAQGHTQTAAVDSRD